MNITKFESGRVLENTSVEEAWNQLLQNRSLAGTDGDHQAAHMPGFGSGVKYIDSPPIGVGFRFSYFGNYGSEMLCIIDEFDKDKHVLAIALVSDDWPGKAHRTYRFSVQGNPDTGNVYLHLEMTNTMSVSQWFFGPGFFGPLGLVVTVLGSGWEALSHGRYLGWPKRPRHKHA